MFWPTIAQQKSPPYTIFYTNKMYKKKPIVWTNIPQSKTESFKMLQERITAQAEDEVNYTHPHTSMYPSVYP